jgi:hypothetical protein
MVEGVERLQPERKLGVFALEPRELKFLEEGEVKVVAALLEAQKALHVTPKD